MNKLHNKIQFLFSPNNIRMSVRVGLRVSFICIVVGQGNPTRGPE